MSFCISPIINPRHPKRARPESEPEISLPRKLPQLAGIPLPPTPDLSLPPCVEQNFSFFEGRALVVGVWAIGVPDKIVTIALGPHSTDCAILNDVLPIQPTIHGDIIKTPLECFGKPDFTRIVFQGCCPIAWEMGAGKCGAEGVYEPISTLRLAYRIHQLMSKTTPGWIFIRHCEATATHQGLGFPEKREKFIQIFNRFGFKHVTNFHPPYRLTTSHPGEDIPDTVPDCPDKWNPENWALVFFKPAELF